MITYIYIKMIYIRIYIYKDDIYMCVCIYIYIPNNKASKHKRQNLIELQREIDESTTVVGNITLH